MKRNDRRGGEDGDFSCESMRSTKKAADFAEVMLDRSGRRYEGIPEVDRTVAETEPTVKSGVEDRSIG